MVLVQSLCAQQTPAAPGAAATTTTEREEEVIVLSPFTVDASSDEGYRATNTLAGSRINTELKNVAASITEVTPQFIKDVGAVDINDVLVYTVGTESTRNFTAAPAAGIGGYEDNPASSPQTANRVRGLHSAQLMRDYFVTIGSQIGFDTYNIDRVTLNRGPNSVLFGLGDPSGSVNFAPKLARTNANSGEVTVRYGSHDDWRASLDVNQVLMEDKLAVRAAALWSDRGFAQEPAYYKDTRGYLTATYQPFEKTTFRVGYERAKVKQHLPNTITPIDHVTSWINAGRPTWDPSTQLWSERPSYFNRTLGDAPLGAVAPDGTLEYAFLENQGERGYATFFQPAMEGVFVRSPLGVSHEDFIDLHELNLRVTRGERELDTFTASWDQQIVKDLFLNVAFLDESMDFSSLGGFRANQFAVHVDVNTNLPDGSPNPHFGELYVPQRSLDSASDGKSSNQAARATLAYSFDFTRNEGWARWLGRHAVTGFVEQREDDTISRGYNGTRTGSPSYLDPADKINVNGWQITYLRYLGGTADTGARVGSGIPYELGVSVPNTYWDATAGAWAQDTWSEYFARKRLDASRNEITSRAAVWQGYFWDDRIVTLFGIRRDKQTSGNLSVTERNPATGETDFPLRPFREQAYLDSVDTASGTTKTYGVVVHPTDWLSLHYNKSETVQVFARGSVNLFGEPIALPTGPGEDYGFSLNLLEGKLNARFNWYQTDIKDARLDHNGSVNIAARWELPWIDQQVIPLIAERYGQTWDADDQFSPFVYGNEDVSDTADEEAKGIEFELTYNPTRNWRIMANAAKQEARRSNIAPALQKWKEEVLPTWQAQPWWTGPIPGGTFTDPWGSSAENLEQVIYNYNSGGTLDTFKAFEGQPNPAIREWRFNFVNTYTFTEGRFKGWNVGGALRWESEAAIGFPAITEVINGTETLVGIDVSDPYEDDGDLNVDLWIGYSRKVWADRYTWNIQLNVRDVTRRDGLRPLVKNSDGTTALYRIEFGPTWYLSSSLSW